MVSQYDGGPQAVGKLTTGGAVLRRGVLAVAAMTIMALCLLAAGMAGPGTAAAGCGGTVISMPSHHPRGQIPPLALGDSTMLLSLPGLAAAGYDANAHGCRQLVQALPILEQLRAERRLPHMVTIALGSNCCASAEQIDQALSILGSGRLLVLATPVDAAAADAVERRVAREHPGRVMLLDWVAYSAGHSSWFQPDGLHLTMPGVAAFTRLLSRAMPYAYEPCPPKRSRRRSSVRAKRYGPRAADWKGGPLSARLSDRAQGWVAAGRISVKAKTRGTVGSVAAVHVRDLWGVGGALLRVCISPPGGEARCRSVSLPPGRSTAVVRVGLRRPGRWTVQVGASSGDAQVRHIWASDRGGVLSVLAAGDSEMQILDGMIGQDLHTKHVHLSSDARISTGLTNTFFFNWQAQARRDAAKLHPDVSVVFIGANDGFSVSGAGGQPVQCCGRAWSVGYGKLVARMMRTLLRGGAGRVYWFLLPAPRPERFKRLFDAVNAGIRLAARGLRGRVSLIDADSFFTPGNRYRDRMSYHGEVFTIHESDGIHLSAAADAIAARLVVRQMMADHVID